MKMIKVSRIFFLGSLLGFLSLTLHPQFSYHGVEFLRAQSPDSLSILDYPHPYSLDTGERKREARLATQFYLKKEKASFLDINLWNFKKSFELIKHNPQKWSLTQLQKLGLFFGVIEFNNTSSLSHHKIVVTLFGLFSFLGLLSLIFLWTHPFNLFSSGFILVYFLFYASSSFRVFLMPMYVILSFLLLKKIIFLIAQKRLWRFSLLLPALFIALFIVRVPYFFPFAVSPKTLKNIHAANGHLVKGSHLLKEKKKYLALKEFSEGLEKWSYHSTLRVEMAKIYLENKEIGRAHNMIRNHKNNPFAHEALGQIFLHYSKINHTQALKNFERARALRPFGQTVTSDS